MMFVFLTTYILKGSWKTSCWLLHFDPYPQYISPNVRQHRTACLIDGMGYFQAVYQDCFDVKHVDISKSEHLYAVFGGLALHILPK